MVINLITSNNRSSGERKASDFLQFISKERKKKRDKLCLIEDKLFNRLKACFWYFEKVKNNARKKLLEEFINNSKKEELILEEEDFQWFTTLPYSDFKEDFERLKLIYSIVRKNFRKYNKYINYPRGYLRPKYLLIGEAPGWHRDTKHFGTRVYTFGRSTILYLLLSSIYFGKSWYTNIFKYSIKDNKKIYSGNGLKNAIKILKKEIRILNPETIVALGNYTFDILSENNIDRPLKKIYHPAYILRQGNDVEMYIENIKKVIGGNIEQ